jgi:hypothetical protein
MSGLTDLEIKVKEFEDELFRRGLQTVIDCSEFVELKRVAKLDERELQCRKEQDMASGW